MAEIHGIVWLFVGLFILIASIWLGTKPDVDIRRFSLFVIAGVIMVITGIAKMIGRREKSEVKGVRGGRFCSRCGAALSGSDRFCPKCGNRIA